MRAGRRERAGRRRAAPRTSAHIIRVSAGLPARAGGGLASACGRNTASSASTAWTKTILYRGLSDEATQPDARPAPVRCGCHDGIFVTRTSRRSRDGMTAALPLACHSTSAVAARRRTTRWRVRPRRSGRVSGGTAGNGSSGVEAVAMIVVGFSRAFVWSFGSSCPGLRSGAEQPREKRTRLPRRGTLTGKECACCAAVPSVDRASSDDVVGEVGGDRARTNEVMRALHRPARESLRRMYVS